MGYSILAVARVFNWLQEQRPNVERHEKCIAHLQLHASGYYVPCLLPEVDEARPAQCQRKRVEGIDIIKAL